MRNDPQMPPGAGAEEKKIHHEGYNLEEHRASGTRRKRRDSRRKNLKFFLCVLGVRLPPALSGVVDNSLAAGIEVARDRQLKPMKCNVKRGNH
jgi:hypothetical protein